MHENKAEAGFILIQIEVKKGKRQLLLSFMVWCSSAATGGETSALAVSCGTTGGAARDIWRVRLVPGRFKDAGVV